MPKVVRHFSLLRILLPSWKFFDGAGSMPRLYYCLESDAGVWLPALDPMPAFQWSQFLVNPAGNLAHARQTLVQRLLQEAMESDPEDLLSSVSYRLVENMVRQRILDRDASSRGRRFQFKISTLQPERVDVLVSQGHEV